MRGLCAGLGIGIVGLRALIRYLVVGGIELHQHIAFMNESAVVEVHLGDMAADTRADGINMSIDLGVIGAFPMPAFPPEPAHQQESDNGNEKHNRLGCRMALKETAAIFGARLRFGIVVLLALALRVVVLLFGLVGLSRRRAHLLTCCLDSFLFVAAQDRGVYGS